jgi:hypothetical protein
MDYLESDNDLYLGALFFLALEDRGDVARQVLDALQGCLTAGHC